jgi:hypothetical protein
MEDRPGPRLHFYGPPDEIESHPQGGGLSRLTFPYEVWHYRDGDKWLLFADRDKTNEFRFAPDIPVRR